MAKRDRRIRKKRQRRRGFLTFEWILLTTVLVIGIIASLAFVRTTLIDEFVELTQAICGVDVGI